MKVDKFKRQATLRVSTGGRLDVNFFLSYSTDEHPGRELIIDILNSERSFIPLEDILKDEILMIGKNRFMDVELTDRDLLPETQEAREIGVQIELIHGDLVLVAALVAPVRIDVLAVQLADQCKQRYFP